MNTLDSLLITAEYWFSGNNCYHVVFAKSNRIAREYARAKGIDMSPIERPTKGLTMAVSIHNANIWYSSLLLPLDY